MLNLIKFFSHLFIWSYIYLLLLLLLLLLLFRAIPVAYGSCQARLGVKLELQPQIMPWQKQHQIWAASVTYTTVHGNAGHLTLRVRTGIEPASCWILVGFITTELQWKLQDDQMIFILCFVNVMYHVDWFVVWTILCIFEIPLHYGIWSF